MMDQRQSRQAIEELQLVRLRSLFKTILPANAFYARKLKPCSLAEAFQSLDHFQAAVPFTTKSEIMADQAAHPPYGTNLTFPVSEYVRCHQTSGSTSAPLSWLDTPDSWHAMVDHWVRIFQAAAITSQDRLFFAFSFGPFLGFWSALEAAQRLGCFVFAGGAMTSQARLEAILHHGMTVLCCTPTYARHLGETARQAKISLARSRVRRIVVAGEPGGSIPATRTSIESLWPGALVFDHHGMTEVGPVTYQCPIQPGVLHVLEPAYFAEVVDPNSGQPSQPGTVGELVLTPLDREGSPLVRYRTGDLVKPRPRGPCRCGCEELALEGGILGRSDDMVIVRGVNVYPSLIEAIVRQYPDIAEFRVTLDQRDAMAELMLEIEPVPGLDQPRRLCNRLEDSLRSTLNLRVPVLLHPPGTLPRFEMKARRWIKLPALSAAPAYSLDSVNTR
jgi:phenylacetate-CoA ligase